MVLVNLDILARDHISYSTLVCHDDLAVCCVSSVKTKVTCSLVDAAVHIDDNHLILLVCFVRDDIPHVPQYKISILVFKPQCVRVVMMILYHRDFCLFLPFFLQNVVIAVFSLFGLCHLQLPLVTQLENSSSLKT